LLVLIQISGVSLKKKKTTTTWCLAIIDLSYSAEWSSALLQCDRTFKFAQLKKKKKTKKKFIYSLVNLYNFTSFMCLFIVTFFVVQCLLYQHNCSFEMNKLVLTLTLTNESIKWIRKENVLIGVLQYAVYF
jgi:hypothetical protein